MRYGIALLALATCARCLAQATSDVTAAAAVTVSSANYRALERGELLRLVDSKNSVNPEVQALSPLKEPKRFVFLQGDSFDSDLSFDDVCAILTPALAAKGYENAVDSEKRVIEPKTVSLVLRVHYGIREWRLPTVRTDALYWADGLVPRTRGRTLSRLGGETIWDERAGGRDNAYADAAMNSANAGDAWSGGGAGSGGQTGATPSSGSWFGSSPTSFEGTQDFHLLVVDAFDYQELKDKGRGAKRLWTTFMAAPARGEQKFSDVVEALARNGTAYFGETTSGLQVFTDARAKVEIGPLRVIDYEVEESATPRG